MAANRVTYAPSTQAAEQGRLGRSGLVWGDFPVASLQEDNSLGALLFDNFLNFGGGPTATAITSGNQNTYAGTDSTWRSAEFTGGSIKMTGTDNPNGASILLSAVGALRMATPATAHADVTMELASTLQSVSQSGLGMFGVGGNAAATVPVAGSLPKLYFEARVRFNQAVTQSLFLGLCVPNKTSAIQSIFGAADVYVTMNAIGFQINGLASATAINAGYGIAGTALTTVGSAGAVPGTLTNWTKLGFIFDPTDQSALRFYQDGVLLGQQTLSQITAANWPSNVPLTPTVCIHTIAASVASLDIDWISVGQILSVE